MFWSLCIFCPELPQLRLHIVIFSPSFFVFRFLRRGVSRCKLCSTAAKDSRSQACLYGLQKQEGPWRGFSTGQQLYGSSSIGVKVSRPQRKKAQGMIRKVEPWQTMDRQPGDTAVCQGWAWREMLAYQQSSQRPPLNTGKRTSRTWPWIPLCISPGNPRCHAGHRKKFVWLYYAYHVPDIQGP